MFWGGVLFNFTILGEVEILEETKFELLRDNQISTWLHVWMVRERHLTWMFHMIYILVIFWHLTHVSWDNSFRVCSNLFELIYIVEACSHGPHYVHFGWWKHLTHSSWSIATYKASPKFGWFACNEVYFSLNLHIDFLTVLFCFLNNI